MRPLAFSIVTAVVLLSFLPGCMSFTTLQSAKTLEPGKVTVGLGAGMMTDGNNSAPVAEAGMRAGIVKNFDFGAKWSFPSLLFLDGKYQILNGPVKVATDLGWSYFSYDGTFGNTRGTSYGWYPMILVGQEHWYAAVKGVYFSTTGHLQFFESQSFSFSRWISTNVILGAVVGTRWKLIPELNLVIPTNGNKNILVPALGLQIEL